MWKQFEVWNKWICFLVLKLRKNSLFPQINNKSTFINSYLCLLRSNQSPASADIGLNATELLAHSEQLENHTEGKKQWFSDIGQFAAVFWPLEGWKQIRWVSWVPKLIAWRKLRSCSTRRGTHTELGSLAELRRHRLEFREVWVARICRADYWREGSSIQKELQRFAEGLLESSAQYSSLHAKQEAGRGKTAQNTKSNRPNTLLKFIICRAPSHSSYWV